MELGVADRLNIKLAFDEKMAIIPSTKGLAGASINGTMVSRNEKAYTVNSSEHDMFDFGESCKFSSFSLCNKNNSVSKIRMVMVMAIIMLMITDIMIKPITVVVLVLIMIT